MDLEYTYRLRGVFSTLQPLEHALPSNEHIDATREWAIQVVTNPLNVTLTHFLIAPSPKITISELAGAGAYRSLPYEGFLK